VNVRFGDFTFDPAGRRLLRGDEVLHVSPKAFDLLRVLIERRPGAVSKADLHELVWPGTFVADASLTMAIAEIRRVLGDDAQTPTYIRTVHRFGYAFCASIEEAAVDASAPPTGERPSAWLTSTDRAFALKDGENIVGRDPGCDVWLDTAGVSRRHARIVLARGAATIEDLGSTNGTRLRDATVDRVLPLGEGDVVRFGGVELRFRRWSDRRATETVRMERGS
jgi:DNA-binding winged helix-turn-helix (wHTH) protein